MCCNACVKKATTFLDYKNKLRHYIRQYFWPLKEYSSLFTTIRQQIQLSSIYYLQISPLTSITAGPCISSLTLLIHTCLLWMLFWTNYSSLWYVPHYRASRINVISSITPLTHACLSCIQFRTNYSSLRYGSHYCTSLINKHEYFRSSLHVKA